jgi:penicillin-binding protein 2
VGCKTGTAEKALGDPHAWFTAFAPFDKPQISVTVIIEDGGEGSSVAGPVAREILDWWFGNQKLETRN